MVLRAVPASLYALFKLHFLSLMTDSTADDACGFPRGRFCPLWRLPAGWLAALAGPVALTAALAMPQPVRLSLRFPSCSWQGVFWSRERTQPFPLRLSAPAEAVGPSPGCSLQGHRTLASDLGRPFQDAGFSAVIAYR